MKDWLDKLRESAGIVSEVPPKGFYSAVQIAKRFGMTRDGALRFISKQVKSGKAVALRLRQRTKNGGVAIVPFYGPKGKR